MPRTTEAHGLEAVEDLLTRTFGRMRLRGSGAAHRARLTSVEAGPVQLHHLCMTAPVDAETDALGAWHLARMTAGTVTRTEGRGPAVTHGAGDTFVAASPDGPSRSRAAGLDVEQVVLPAGLIAQVADPHPRRAPRPVRFRTWAPASPAGARMWVRACDFARSQADDAPDGVLDLVAGQTARLLAATALAAFPNDALTDATAQDRRDAHPETLRRAVAFAEENAHRDIGPADLARAAHVSIRALQLAFRRHLDCTPSVFLRRVRLDRVHRVLLDGDPATTGVGSVAAAWGFANHSRFAARYRAAYGVTPSETLHR